MIEVGEGEGEGVESERRVIYRMYSYFALYSPSVKE